MENNGLRRQVGSENQIKRSSVLDNGEKLRMVRCFAGGTALLMEARFVQSMDDGRLGDEPVLANLLGLPGDCRNLRRLHLRLRPDCVAAVSAGEPIGLEMIEPAALHALPDFVRARMAVPAIAALAFVDDRLHLVVDPALLFADQPNKSG